MRRPQRREKMHMIARATHCVSNAALRPQDTTDVFVQSWTQAGREPRLTIFCAKDEMIVQ